MVGLAAPFPWEPTSLMLSDIVRTFQLGRPHHAPAYFFDGIGEAVSLSALALHASEPRGAREHVRLASLVRSGHRRLEGDAQNSLRGFADIPLGAKCVVGCEFSGAAFVRARGDPAFDFRSRVENPPRTGPNECRAASFGSHALQRSRRQI